MYLLFEKLKCMLTNLSKTVEEKGKFKRRWDFHEVFYRKLWGLLIRNEEIWARMKVKRYKITSRVRQSDGADTQRKNKDEKLLDQAFKRRMDGRWLW